MATALITGANRGLGLALTEGYAGQGWRVAAASRYSGTPAGFSENGVET